MKKIIAYLLVAMMCLSSLAACGNNEPEQGASNLDNAIAMIKTMYLKEKGAATPNDYVVASQVIIDGTVYKIDWTVDNEAVKVVPGEENVTIDVNEKSETEVAYKLTATVKEGDATKSITFDYTIPAYKGYGAIVDALYALADGETLEDGAEYAIEGKVIAINTGYADGKITVTFVTSDRPDKPIQCYNLKPGAVADVSKIEVGDTITAKGPLKNYKNTFEFNGCVLEAHTPGAGAQTFASADELLAAVEKLEVGYGIAGKQTVTGVITSITDSYDGGTDYANATVIITVGERQVTVYRVGVADSADLDKLQALAIGDTITVSGHIMRYKENVLEFVQGCTLDAYTAGAGSTEPEKPVDPKPEDPKPSESLDTPEKILKAAYELEAGKYLGGSKDSKYTLTGVISEIKLTYKPEYTTIAVWIKVAGLEDYPILCYGLSGNGIDVVAVGDTITVTGPITNYSGTIEFNYCSLDSYTSNGSGTDTPADKPADTPASTAPALDASAKEILTAAYALGQNESLGSQKYTLTGVITSFKYTYNPDFDNIQCTIVCDGLEDMPIVCYKLKGNGIDKVQVGSTITVTGEIKNYNGMVEFNGCTLDSYK